MRPAMNNMKHTVRTSLVFLAGVSLVACAPFFGDSQTWQPSPGTRVSQTDLRPSIGYYENAVTAINARHYALALEYLQRARAQKPDDVRVLTAFGVVYDKLGRFDLSTRYYTQAAAVEPQSKIIAADLDYSRRLQGFAAAGAAPRMAQAGPAPAEGARPEAVAQLLQAPIATALAAPRVAQAGPVPAESAKPQTVAQLTQAPIVTALAAPARAMEKPASSRKADAKILPKAKTDTPIGVKVFFLTGHPLTIIDASGRNDAGKSVRSYLSGRGWSVAKGADPKLPARAQTVIVYQESMSTAAKALARTLSLPMRLTASKDVQGLQLILGGDVSGTDLAGRTLGPQRRQLALAAADRKRQE